MSLKKETQRLKPLVFLFSFLILLLSGIDGGIAMGWQLQNMSKEHREIFLYLPGSKKPQTKVVPPHTSVTIPGTTGLEVVDGKTGQKLVNPQGKNMWITPEGHIRMR